jgi:hypothetical protein
MSIEQFPGARWLQNNWSELRVFNFQWIAASGDGIISHNPELEIVINEVIVRELTTQSVYAFVDFDEEEAE